MAEVLRQHFEPRFWSALRVRLEELAEIVPLELADPHPVHVVISIAPRFDK